MEKLIGLYGGTFDPPHNAHFAVAQSFVSSFPHSSLTVMPCFVPPHKAVARGGASPEARLEMARLCFERLPRTSVSDMELSAGGTSYTYLTVQRLMRLYPESKVCLLMGYDNLEIFEKWRNFRFLLENCKLAVVGRGSMEAEEKAAFFRKEYGADITVLPMELSALSSTAIRGSLAEGVLPEEALSRPVCDYIESRGLYMDADIGAILEYIGRLSPRRRVHTMNVEKAAWMLAKNHYPALDKRAVAAAAYLHDCTKEISAEEHFALCEQYGVVLDSVEEANPKLLHAKTGAAVAKALFGIRGGAYDAIMYHTTARADMTDFDKVLFLADFIECGRTDDFCVSVRKRYFKELARCKEKAVDRTLLFAMTKSVEILEEELKPIHPHTLEARNFLKEQLADEDDYRGTEE